MLRRDGGERRCRIPTMNSGSGSDGSATAAAARPSATSNACARLRQKPARNDRTDKRAFIGSRIGRGHAQGTVSASRRPAGARRVVIKARIVRIKAGDNGAVRAHLRYVQRDGVTREGNPGELYDAGSDRADGKAFAERGEEDRHQFRFIVAPGGQR